MPSKWEYTPDNRIKLGPFSLDGMAHRIKSGQLKPHYMVRREGTTKWAAADRFPELVELFAQIKTAIQAVPNRESSRKDQAEEDQAEEERIVPRKRTSRGRAARSKQGFFASPQALWIILGSVLLSVSLLVVLVLVLPHRSPPRNSEAQNRTQEEKQPKPEIQPAPPPAPLPAPPAPRKTLQELFALLAPSVPLVEAVDAGTGSGFLVQQDGKRLVITNRHVVENARQGVAIHFMLGEGKRFSIPKEKTSVVAIHRVADLAVIDVSRASDEIQKLGIEPVRLALAGQQPKVGQHVFAIGHPGGEAVGLLTSTLSDGIVSAVGRSHDNARFLQVTVPMNPGNSGGPLFDDAGRVVGVNTFIIRKNAKRDIPLESLNFALESHFIQEILTQPDKILDARAVAALLAPPEEPEVVAKAMAVKLTRFQAAGYSPLNDTLARSTKIFRLKAENRHLIRFICREPGDYAVAAVNQGADDIDLVVLNNEGVVVASDIQINPDPEVVFRVREAGVYHLIVINASETDATVLLTLLKKVR